VAVAAKQKRSHDPDRKVKQQVCGNTTIRPANMIEHFDNGLWQAPAPAFASYVAPDHIKGVVAPSHWAGRIVTGAALPYACGSHKPPVLGPDRMHG
jgi:hypothetical protein